MKYEWCGYLGGYPEERMAGEGVPTADHPPENILMGGETGESPGVPRDGGK